MWSNVISEHSITIQWKLNCVDKATIAGYNITYCPVGLDFEADLCIDAVFSEIVILSAGEDLHEFEIKNLRSYMRYNISVALMSINRLGLPKSPITVQTLEGGKLGSPNFATCYSILFH